MINLAFFHPEERTECADVIFGAVGRALTLAKHYEMNCKSLANVMDLRENADLLNNKDAFTGLFKRIQKQRLQGSIDKFASIIKCGLKYSNISDEVLGDFQQKVLACLHEGREDRNEIAHEITMRLLTYPQDESVVDRIR
jgi:hypothetical protein